MAMISRPPPLSECPRSPDSLTFSTYWYRLRSIPYFLVCTKCYEENVVHTQSSSAFELFYHSPTPDMQATCMFNSPEIKRLFNNTVQSPYGYNDAFNTFMSAASYRSKAKPCPGMNGVDADRCVQWYGVHQIPDFMVCEACYLDFVRGSMFENNIMPYPTRQQPGQIWACDIAIPNVKRHFAENSKRHDWAGFVNAASHRIHQPRCDGSEKSLTQRNWYTPKAIPNMLICETCYLDEISLTSNMSEFCELRSKWTHQPSSQIMGRCSFSSVAVQICSNQLLERNFGAWLQLMNQIIGLRACSGNSVQDNDLYFLVNPWTHRATDYGFCEACYLGCIESSNNAHMFRRERNSSPRYCEFSPSNPRMGESVAKLTELLLTRDSSKLIEYATRLQPQPIQPPQSQPQPQPQTQNSQNQQVGTSNWQAISAQLAQQHAMKMSMNNMLFAQNSMHNAAMNGIWSQGSSYNKWHDTTYTNAQYNYTQAQNQMFSAMGGQKY